MMFSISELTLGGSVDGGIVGGGVVVEGGIVGGGTVVNGGIVGGGVVVNGGIVGGGGNVGVVNCGTVGVDGICAPLDCIRANPATATAPSPTTARNIRRIPAPPRPAAGSVARRAGARRGPAPARLGL